MPITTKTITTGICDRCLKDIHTQVEKWVNASVYGVAFHVECWNLMGGPETARLLGLDDIEATTPDGETGRAW